MEGYGSGNEGVGFVPLTTEGAAVQARIILPELSDSEESHFNYSVFIPTGISVVERYVSIVGQNANVSKHREAP